MDMDDAEEIEYEGQINMDRQGEQQIIDDELGDEMDGEEIDAELDDDQHRELLR